MEKKRLSFDGIKADHFSWIVALTLTLLLTGGIFFYWQQAISFEGLVFWVLGLVVIGLVFVFGARLAQRDGFQDGFKNGLNGAKREKT